MKQGARHAHAVPGRGEFRSAGEIAAEGIDRIAPGQGGRLGQGLLKGIGRQSEHAGKFSRGRGFSDRARGDRFAVIVELVHQIVQTLVVDRDRNVIGLRQDIHRLLGIAQRFVGKAPALEVYLDPSFQDDRPQDGHAVTLRETAVALVGADVGNRRAEFPAPLDRLALVARMTEELRVTQFGDIFGHHFLIAGETAAGQDQRSAAQVLGAAVRSLATQTVYTPFGIGVEVADARVSQQVGAGVGAGVQQAAHQFGPGAVGAAMQTHDAVTRIQEAVDQRKRHTAFIRQPLHGARGLAGQRQHHVRIGLPPGLGEHVVGEQLRRVLDPLLVLHPGSGARDQAGGHARGADRRGVALEYEHFGASLAGGEPGAQAASACAHYGHADIPFETGVLGG